MSRLTMIAAALAAAGLLAGCTTHAATPIAKKQLALTRSFKLFPIYWAGRRLDGVPVTAADGPRSYDSNIGMTVYYGNCEPTHALLPDGCKLPLKITTVLFVPHANTSLGPRRKATLRGVPAVIFDDGHAIELYTDRMAVDVVADTPRRALQAVAHLTPLNSPLPAGWPALPAPEFKPGVSAKQLAAEAGASGSTGTVSPPGELQPNVNATQ